MGKRYPRKAVRTPKKVKEKKRQKKTSLQRELSCEHKARSVPISFFRLGAINAMKSWKQERISMRVTSKIIELVKVRFCVWSPAKPRFAQGELINGSAWQNMQSVRQIWYVFDKTGCDLKVSMLDGNLRESRTEFQRTLLEYTRLYLKKATLRIGILSFPECRDWAFQNAVTGLRNLRKTPPILIAFWA